MILEEFDPTKKAIINPEDVQDSIADFPRVVVSCFARTTFERLIHSFKAEEIARTSMANIEIPIYRIKLAGVDIGLYNSPVGAAACVAILEDIIAMGAERFVIFGTCGVLDESIQETSVIVPTFAIRDEGTSYHYQPASDKISLDSEMQGKLIQFLKREGISYSQGGVWTTDAIYRETIGKLQTRKAQGAICVDMECSAIAALAAFRKVAICQLFYAADHLSEEKWDARTISNESDLEEKDKIAQLALAVALEL